MNDKELIEFLDWITRRNYRPSLQNGYWFHPTDLSKHTFNSAELLRRYKEHKAKFPNEVWPNSKIPMR